ncbi:hypothetical protein CHH27_21005 [Labrenzia sp. VG12]|nr:hypothetical protein CHH27_21005 [Labrenzia sp. VG12]
MSTLSLPIDLILRKRRALSRRTGGILKSKRPILRDASKLAPQDEGCGWGCVQTACDRGAGNEGLRP